MVSFCECALIITFQGTAINYRMVSKYIICGFVRFKKYCIYILKFVDSRQYTCNN